MKWNSFDTISDGFPLYMRKPEYENVWANQNNFTELFCITHKLEKVKQNGLPKQEYNRSLSDFDHHLCELFDNNKQGIIVLIETYGGERNYWYYIKLNSEYTSNIDLVKHKYPQQSIEIWSKKDTDWGFLKTYPITLYASS